MSRITYLKDAKNLQELKKLYFALAKKHHPDVAGGNLEIMKQINNEYDYLKTVLKNAEDTKTAEKESTATMEGFQFIIDKLMKYKNIKMELIGSWAWISGRGTFAIKQEILYDELHIGYSKPQKKFYWYDGINCINGKPEARIKGGYLKKAIDKYGITTINSNPSLSLN